MFSIENTVLHNDKTEQYTMTNRNLYVERQSADKHSRPGQRGQWTVDSQVHEMPPTSTCEPSQAGGVAPSPTRSHQCWNHDPATKSYMNTSCHIRKCRDSGIMHKKLANYAECFSGLYAPFLQIMSELYSLHIPLSPPRSLKVVWNVTLA